MRLVVLTTIIGLAGLFGSPLFGDSIVVPNGSFETPVYLDGSGSLTTSSEEYDGWQFQDSAAGQFGIINPDDARFAGTTGSPGLLPSPADGQQYGVLGTKAGTTVSITDVLPLATIQANMDYILSLAAGNEITGEFSSFQGTLDIALLADGVVVSSDSIAYSTITRGDFVELSTSFSSATDAFTVGEDLSIKISYTAGPTFGDNGVFDNIQVNSSSVTSAAVPEPSTWMLLLAGGVMIILFRRFRRAKR